MEYSNIMTDAVRVFNDRNPKYGDMRIGMENVATMATIMTGMHLTAHDVALVLHAVKLSRLGNDRTNPDHYVDGVNYLAFAGELITQDPYGTADAMAAALDDGAAEMAAKLSPVNQDTPGQGC
jgi:hypothetical protein